MADRFENRYTKSDTVREDPQFCYLLGLKNVTRSETLDVSPEIDCLLKHSPSPPFPCSPLGFSGIGVRQVTAPSCCTSCENMG